MSFKFRIAGLALIGKNPNVPDVHQVRFSLLGGQFSTLKIVPPFLFRGGYPGKSATI
tara:strand:+ start:216 stop:386 length:171 start_codon:yes stop_codon:yes gene_type:complete